MRIKRCRLSLIWTAPIPDLLAAPAPGPLGDLMTPSSYAVVFNALLNGNTHPVADLPWPHTPAKVLPERNKFWSDAIVQAFLDSPKADRGRLAWKALIPLRHVGTVFGLDYGERSVVEGWYVPTGSALSVTLWLAGDLDGAQIRQAVSDACGAPLPVSLGPNKSVMRLDEAAAQGLDMLRRQGFGFPPAHHADEAIRVLTVIAAEHDPQEKDKPAAEAAMLQDVLVAAGASPADTIVPTRNIYALPHARVIWRPDCFLSTAKGLHKLGCLHRNVTLATIHVASLVRAAEIMMVAIGGAGAVPPRIAAIGRCLAGLLGRLNSRDDAYVYKQQCLRDQISAAKTTIDRLRDRFNMSPLQ